MKSFVALQAVIGLALLAAAVACFKAATGSGFTVAILAVFGAAAIIGAISYGRKS